MHERQLLGDEGSKDIQPKVQNGQLPTPALSPISEHGQREPPVVFGYDADDEGAFLANNPDTPVILEANMDDLLPPQSENERRRKSSSATSNTSKLSPQQMQELVSSPESLPIRTIPSIEEQGALSGNGLSISKNSSKRSTSDHDFDATISDHTRTKTPRPSQQVAQGSSVSSDLVGGANESEARRPSKGSRSASTPLMNRRRSTSMSRQTKDKQSLAAIRTEAARHTTVKDSSKPAPRLEVPPSPMQQVLPLPPLSLPTYLQLELSSDRPSALYLHRSASSDFPYESSKVKFERLYNFLLLPGFLEQILWFGAVACLDAWLYTFTILPLRFLKALAILGQWWARNAFKEIFDLCAFVYEGVGRVWQRRHQKVGVVTLPSSRRPSMSNDESSRRLSANDEKPPKVEPSMTGVLPEKKARRVSKPFRHRRTRSTPSALRPNHKADLLQGCLIVVSSYVLMWFDASRMYHNIRGQSAIKLYVIYNVLEVFDRLFSALGQDILECLFSKETLERDEDGRSKVIRPLWMFILALVYNVIHSTALFYQVVTLNVAVNSYSNALLTLLMSNQFVEIKGTVFKKFEKENLFQLTCADVVERFQLWLMLMIIALRNIVEVGGLSVSLGSAFGSSSFTNNTNATSTSVPIMGGIVIPKAFTLMPKWTGEVLAPFLIVLGSEMLVDWCKHAYISKFNNIKPSIYGRFFDVLAKDYYSHAFADQNLTKRLGLPVIPLSCLFIRACVQTYYMLLATHFPPMPASETTSLSLESGAASTSPATMAAIKHIDHVFRRALGRSAFGAGFTSVSFSWWGIDDLIAIGTMVTFFLALYLLLLACKLVLGMCLLSIARNRYRGMKEREHAKTTTDGRRVGGWGAVEVGDEKRRWIYEDDPESLRQLREKEEKTRSKTQAGDRLDSIDRYSMAAKRIW